MHHPHVLFILRDVNAPSNDYLSTAASGVAVSSRMIAQGIRDFCDASIAAVSEESEIDYILSKHPQATHVVIETLWVTPQTIRGLCEKYSDKQWLIRDHSESCFRVLEPNAFGWILSYLDSGVKVLCNGKGLDDLYAMASGAGYSTDLVGWGPNLYPVSQEDVEIRHNNTSIARIGCFGSVRPMKNHITQALAAIRFATAMGVSVEFHINGYTIPGYVDPVLNNLRDMFMNMMNCSLIEHDWMSHDDFLGLLKTMDICSQVSFTETFNVVAADAVNGDVPIIVSKEIPWVGSYAVRSAQDVADIAEGYTTIWNEGFFCRRRRLRSQRKDLRNHNISAYDAWYRLLTY